MKVFRETGALIQHQRARGKLTVKNIGDMHTKLADFGKRDFKSMSRGIVKTKTLQAMGHPFARNGGLVEGAQRGITKGGDWKKKGYRKQIHSKVMLERLPINYQTGQLYRGITLDGPKGKDRTYQLYSKARHAKYVLALDGTDKMVPRFLKGPQGALRKRHLLRQHNMKDILVRSHRMA